MSELEYQRNTIRKVVSVFGIVCMIVGLLVMAGTTAVYFSGEKSRYWPKTNGQILSSKVIQYERGSSGSTLSRSVAYKPEITYSYSLNNKTYTNDRVSFSPIGGGHRGSSQHYVSAFKVGESYSVFYDSNNPQNSTLVKGTSALNLAAIFSGVVFLLFGLVLYKMRNIYADSVPDNSTKKGG